jgi:hypothetical protein
VEAHDRLIERVAAEQDDVLCTLQLVQGDGALEDHLFEQLVNLLVEGMFLELRQSYLDGGIDRDAYVAQLADLAAHCRRTGLLPLPTRQ